MSQTEHARVQALLESGRITEDEAEILFAALGEDSREETPSLPPQASTDSSSNDDPLGLAELESLRQDVTDEELGLTELKPVQPPPSASALPPHPPEPPRGPKIADTTQQTQWVKLSGFCGDLFVEVDASLSSPTVTGKATLERTPEGGYLIRTPPQAKGENNWFTKLHQAAGDVKVRLPAEMGLDLRIAAGDGEVRGVKSVKGSFTGGDFGVSGAETLDLAAKAGDISLKLRPRKGEQRLRAIAGDVNVTFLTDSSVSVSGKAKCGDLTLPKNFTRNGSFVGGTFEGTLGAGEAHLELRLIAGDITIKGDA